MPELEKLIGDFAKAMAKDNETMIALGKHFKEGTGKQPISITSFSSATKYSSATFQDAAYVLGAPEFVLREQFTSYEPKINAYGSEGYRVLVFGIYHGKVTGKVLTESVTPLGLILLSNPIRKEAKDTFQYFAKQNVEVKVISGDNPVTVSQVAKQAGIENAHNYVDASTLETKEWLLVVMLRHKRHNWYYSNQIFHVCRRLCWKGGE